MSDLIERLRNEIAIHDSLSDGEDYEFINMVTLRNDIVAACDALELATCWVPVTEGLPNEYETVLVQHVDDLYPVTAYRMQPNVAAIDDVSLWVYESDGPEDIEDGPQHRHLSLWRDPTHWMPLPESPLLAGDKSG